MSGNNIPENGMPGSEIPVDPDADSTRLRGGNNWEIAGNVNYDVELFFKSFVPNTFFPAPTGENVFRGEHIEFLQNLLVDTNNPEAIAENPALSELTPSQLQELQEVLQGALDSMKVAADAAAAKNITGGIVTGGAVGFGLGALVVIGGIALSPFTLGASLGVSAAVLAGGAAAGAIGAYAGGQIAVDLFQESAAWEMAQKEEALKALNVYFETLRENNPDFYNLLVNDTGMRQAGETRHIADSILSDPANANEKAKTEILHRVQEEATAADAFFGFTFTPQHKQFLAKSSDADAVAYFREIGIELNLNNPQHRMAFGALRAQGTLLNKGIKNATDDASALGIDWVALWQENQQLETEQRIAIFERIQDQQHQGFQGLIDQFLAKIEKFLLTGSNGQSPIFTLLSGVFGGVLGDANTIVTNAVTDAGNNPAQPTLTPGGDSSVDSLSPEAQAELNAERERLRQQREDIDEEMNIDEAAAAIRNRMEPSATPTVPSR